MRLIYIALALSAATLSFTACNSGTETPANTTSEAPAPKIERPPAASKLSSEGTQQLMNLVSKYYALKNALVATKATDADSAATALSEAATQMDAQLQKDSANYNTIKPYLDTVMSQSKVIATLTDKKCEPQRVVFEHVSSAIYGLLKVVEVKNAGTYRQYCPMAFNNKGAYWLSEEEEIKNPYFGKKMLECGEVTDSL